MSPESTSLRPHWSLRRPDRERVRELVSRHALDELGAVLLANREHAAGDALKRHLHPALDQLHDPELLPGMAAACERLERALREQETILIHGDYDVDGVTGTALLVRLLRLLGADVRWHIPHRLHDGYSFGPHSVERARETGATLVISVDNGTSAVETIADLAAVGVDTIVTDHHEPPLGDLPAAVAIVNPKLADSTYPFRELCGGAVAFKLAWGLCQRVSGARRVRPDLKDFLVDAMGYVAIATVCDVVPLVDENRVLARFGLKALAASQQPGLRALLTECGLFGRTLEAEDVGFQIGPRINAAGRLDSAARAVEVLLAADDLEGRAAAKRLDELNVRRKQVEREVLEEAAAAARPFEDESRWPVLVLAGQGWHQGVVGIVAARLSERYARPSIVVGLSGEEGRGSARSVPGFSVLDAMHGGREHMLRYGGHAAAAGCEVRADAVDALREAVCAEARRLAPDGYPAPRLVIDAEVALNDVGETLQRRLDDLGPWGERNEKPVLLSRDLRLAEPPRVVGQDRSHLILRLRRGEKVLKALAFGMAHRLDELRPGVPLHAVHTPRWNEFRGERSVELLLHDFTCGDLPDLDPS